MSRIFLTGDTHGSYDIHKLSSLQFPISKGLTKEDYVIILGDFGLVWDTPTSKKDEQHWLDWLSSKPWITLFIDGNHENHDRLQTLKTVAMFGSVVGQVTNSIFHLRRGHVYTINNNTFFCMGGAYSIDKLYRTPFLSWWPQEEPSYDEFALGLKNLDGVGWRVDYILGHTGPLQVVQYLGAMVGQNFGKKEDSVNRFFESIVFGKDKVVKFKKMFFAHYHCDKEITDKYEVLYHKIKELVDA